MLSKECFEKIDFWDSELIEYKIENNDLIIFIELWNAKIKKIVIDHIYFIEFEPGETGCRPFEVEDPEYINKVVGADKKLEFKLYHFLDWSGEVYFKAIGKGISIYEQQS